MYSGFNNMHIRVICVYHKSSIATIGFFLLTYFYQNIIIKLFIFQFKPVLTMSYLFCFQELFKNKFEKIALKRNLHKIQKYLLFVIDL